MSAPPTLADIRRSDFDRKTVEAEVARAAVEDRVPFDGGRTANGIATPPAEDVFTGADLTLDLMPEGVEFPVVIKGKTKRLWVHGISDEDQGLVLKWTLGRDDGSEPRTPQAQRLKQQELVAAAQIFQVIAACRVGPRRDASRCFEAADFAAVRRFLPRTTIGEIVSLSERLTGGGEAMGPGVRRFFELIRTCLQTSASVSGTSENCPPGFRDILAACESLALRATKDGIWDSGMSEALEALEAWQPSSTN